MHIQKMTYSAIFLALCILLPFLTLQTVPLGNMFSLMHIPVFLCGFLCGWPYGLSVGFMAPLLRNLLFSMPPFPRNIAMAAELAVYGLTAGLLYRLFPKKTGYLYVSLLLSMLLGRIAWGIVTSLLVGNFTFSAFLAGAFLNAVPGIICHIALVPILVLALLKSGVFHAKNQKSN